MPDNDVWPPKPSLIDPLAEYDELIEARLPTLSAMTPDWDLLVPKSPLLLPGLRSLLPLGRRLSPGVPLDDRVLLLQALREDRGLDFWQAQAVVKSYYQRHGMERTPRAVFKTLLPPLVGVGLALGAVIAILVSHYLSFHRDAILRQPNHGAAIIALDNAKSLLQTVSLTLLALIYGFWFLRYLVLRVRHKRAGAVAPAGNALRARGGTSEGNITRVLSSSEGRLSAGAFYSPGIRPPRCPTTTYGPQSPPCPTR